MKYENAMIRRVWLSEDLSERIIKAVRLWL
jgi:hypothetical protein